MSTGEVNSSLTGDETNSLDGNEVEDVNSAATSLSVPNTSEEVARQIRRATDPLKKQLEKLYDLMEELRRDTTRRNEGTSAPTQGPSGPREGPVRQLLMKNRHLSENCFSIELSHQNILVGCASVRLSAIARCSKSSYLLIFITNGAARSRNEVNSFLFKSKRW